MPEQKISKDFWVAIKKFHTGPTFMKDVGDGQKYLRDIAYEYVKKWRGCIDAGSNVGMWTRWLMNDFETVHCFEPNPIFNDCFKRNIPLDKNAVLHEVGLGSEEGTANFTEPLDQRLQRSSGDIKIKTLDSYNLTNIDFIKIDVDGYEDLLMEGARKTITQNNPVINIEMKRYKGKKRLRAVHRAENILLEYGYRRQNRKRSEEVWIKK
jgi:FkbM family methyltransferase